MAAPKLSLDKLREILHASHTHGGVNQAARALGIPSRTAQARWREAMARKSEIDAADKQADPDHPKGMPFEREWERWLDHIGAFKDGYKGPAKKKAGKRKRIIAAGDFHIPFHDRGALAELVAHANGADALVIGGDFGDAHCASTFTKYEDVSYEEEHAGKTAVMQVLSETFPEVYYLKGSNHTDRFEKRIREKLSSDVVAAIQSMTGGPLNPDLVLVKRYPNVKVLGWKTPNGADVSWLGVLGDVAFTHAEKYSVTPGAALRKVEEWLDDFSGHLGLPKMRAVVQFHTHAAAMFPYKSDMLLIEPGCMCQIHSYQLGSKIGGRPQRLGYVTMELENDHLDVNSIRWRWLDANAA